MEARLVSPEWILQNYRPGSFDPPWSWVDEKMDLEKRGELTVPFGNRYQDTAPVVLGNDGRVWDGHHRILAARRAGVEIKAEFVEVQECI